MLAALSILPALAIGCMLVYGFAGLRAAGPRWAAALLIFGAGAALGIGIASCLFFLCRVFVPAAPLLPMLLELALLAWLSFEVFRRRQSISRPAAGSFSWHWGLAVALLIVLTIATVSMSGAWTANPQGNWDAWAIWNLRARFLASPGTLAHRAWSPDLTSSHPGYPLLLSGFVARCWSYGHSIDEAVPIATAYLFFLALLAIGIGGVTVLRGASLGLLFGLLLAGTPALLHEVPAQYADVPLACYFLGALVLAMSGRPLWAGLFAGMAAWTKDEGLLFLVVFLALMAAFRRKEIGRVLAGAAPVGLIVALFKLVLARGTHSLVAESSAGVLPRLMDPTRYLTVISGFVRGMAGWGSAGYHPILPLVVLAPALGLTKEWRREIRLPGLITLAMLSGYFAVYVITRNDLNWQLDTSLGRLFVQIWPLTALAVFSVVRSPESLFVRLEKVPAKVRRRRK
jgi:hypothetical protein